MTKIAISLSLVFAFLLDGASFLLAEEPPVPASDGGSNRVNQVADLNLKTDLPAAAAVPQAAVPQAAVPQAAVPQAAVPQAVVPQAVGKQVIATTDGDWPDITAEILELKRSSGNTLTLKFRINNSSDKNLDYGYSFGSGSTSDIGTIGGVTLLDPENKKKYFIVRDSEGKCLCSTGLKPVVPGSKGNLWAKFPAPPANVSKITVAIPHFIPVDDLPIG